MTKNKLLQKFNWRLLFTHFFATIFLIAATRQLMLYYTLEDCRIIMNALDPKHPHPLDIMANSKYENMTMEKLGYRVLAFPHYASLVAILIAFFISLTLAIKNKIFWINPLIVLILSFTFFRIGSYKTDIARDIFYSFGHLFKSFGEVYFYVSNALLLLAISLTIFFSKWTKIFITTRESERGFQEQSS